jgi:hypothetical protein
MIYALNGTDNWQLVFKVYTTDGMLIGLSDIITPSIKSQWRVVKGFLKSSQGDIREVCISRKGRTFSSLICRNGQISFSTPIRAMV